MRKLDFSPKVFVELKALGVGDEAAHILRYNRKPSHA